MCRYECKRDKISEKKLEINLKFCLRSCSKQMNFCSTNCKAVRIPHNAVTNCNNGQGLDQCSECSLISLEDEETLLSLVYLVRSNDGVT